MEFQNPEKRSGPLYETLKETSPELPRPPLFLQKGLESEVLFEPWRFAACFPMINSILADV